MKILELGNYIVPAYAGMLLAEQGYLVTKWVNGTDPILHLHRGNELWQWLNAGKTLENRHPCEVKQGGFDVIIDNFRPSTLQKWGIDPVAIADEFGIVWVSMRSEVGEISFDLLAQCRSWMEYAPWVPFYVGDTAGGLWLAFKALSARSPGHYQIGHASCLQKLVEGELVIEIKRDGVSIPWDKEAYAFTGAEAEVEYRGQVFREPRRDRRWKLDHLWHRQGRIVI